MGKLYIIDVSIVGIYLVFITLVGSFQDRRVKSLEEYTVGNRNFSTFAIVATILATYISSHTVIGNNEKIHELSLS